MSPGFRLDPACGPRPACALRGFNQRCLSHRDQAFTWSWTFMSRAPLRLGWSRPDLSRCVACLTSRRSVLLQLERPPPTEVGACCPHLRGRSMRLPFTLPRPRSMPRSPLPHEDRSRPPPSATEAASSACPVRDDRLTLGLPRLRGSSLRLVSHRDIQSASSTSRRRRVWRRLARFPSGLL
jgi:hypothetical protein